MSTKSNKASKQVLERLHAELAEVFRNAIRGQVDPETGEAKVDARILKEAREFLKDNGVEAAVTDRSPLGLLNQAIPEDELPFAGH